MHYLPEVLNDNGLFLRLATVAKNTRTDPVLSERISHLALIGNPVYLRITVSKFVVFLRIAVKKASGCGTTHETTSSFSFRQQSISCRKRSPF